MSTEYYDRVQEDLGSGFGGLQGRGAKKQDPAIERELVLSLEEIFHGCTKKMKISRRVIDHFHIGMCSFLRCTDNALADYWPADYRCQIIGRLSANYRLFISGRIFVQ